MNKLESYYDYDFIKTPVVCLEKYAKNKNLFLKLEGENLNGSIKSRTAYFMIKDLVQKGIKNNIVESSSGNLGLNLGYFSKMININFLCLMDITVTDEKIRKFNLNNIPYEIVALEHYADYRSARIEQAKKLAKEGWIWTNQYENLANVQAHYTTTGPELYEQLEDKIDYFVCAAGSGGTISGVSKYLKEKNKDITVVFVEPEGSTIFGGTKKKYITAGAGLDRPSGIMRSHWHLFDYSAKVEDEISISVCKEVKEIEGISVGITTGSVLYVAQYLAERYPDKIVGCISPDGGQCYEKELQQCYERHGRSELILNKVH